MQLHTMELTTNYHRMEALQLYASDLHLEYEGHILGHHELIVEVLFLTPHMPELSSHLLVATL